MYVAEKSEHFPVMLILKPKITGIRKAQVKKNIWKAKKESQESLVIKNESDAKS